MASRRRAPGLAGSTATIRSPSSLMRCAPAAGDSAFGWIWLQINSRIDTARQPEPATGWARAPEFPSVRQYWHHSVRLGRQERAAEHLVELRRTGKLERLLDHGGGFVDTRIDDVAHADLPRLRRVHQRLVDIDQPALLDVAFHQ